MKNCGMLTPAKLCLGRGKNVGPSLRADARMPKMTVWHGFMVYSVMFFVIFLSSGPIVSCRCGAAAHHLDTNCFSELCHGWND